MTERRNDGKLARRLVLSVCPSFRLSVLLAAPLLAQDPLARRWDHVALHHDALRYDVAISLPDTGGVIHAAVTTRWRLTGTGPVVLDLVSGLTVRSASVNGAAARWRREGNRIVIPVRGHAGDSLTTAIAYDGAPRDGLVFRGAGAERRGEDEQGENDANHGEPPESKNNAPNGGAVYS